ncbi:MAG: PG0541 family transporter-associated protein [Marinifilaceae bacterium]
MKAVFIIYNQALTERVDYMLSRLEVRGYTQWQQVNGAGSVSGEPRMGTHTWPEMNSSLITIVPDEKVPLILKYVQKLDEVNEENGIRAFVWNITDMY